MSDFISNSFCQGVGAALQWTEKNNLVKFCNDEPLISICTIETPLRRVASLTMLKLVLKTG